MGCNPSPLAADIRTQLQATIPWKRQPEPHPGLPCRSRARRRAPQDGRQTSGYQMGGSREMGKCGFEIS